MKTLSLAFVLVLLSCGQATSDLKELEKQLVEEQEIKLPEPEKGFKAINSEKYWISYPEDWTVDTSGAEGLMLTIFSPLSEAADGFQENINMTTEAMPNSTITPEFYAESALKMIETSIPGFELVENKGYKGKYGDYQKIVYTGDMSGMKLQWKQLVFVKDLTASIVTFTSTKEDFGKFDGISDKIMKSFIQK